MLSVSHLHLDQATHHLRTNLPSNQESRHQCTTTDLRDRPFVTHSPLCLTKTVPFFSSKRTFSFFRFLFTDWKHSVHLSSNHPAQEQVPKHPILLCNGEPELRRRVPPSVIRARRRSRGRRHHNRRNTFFIIHGETGKIPLTHRRCLQFHCY